MGAQKRLRDRLVLMQARDLLKYAKLTKTATNFNFYEFGYRLQKLTPLVSDIDDDDDRKTADELVSEAKKIVEDHAQERLDAVRKTKR